MARRIKFVPWSGISGVVETVALPPTGVLGAAALASSFAGAATVSAGVTGTLGAAALASSFAGVGTGTEWLPASLGSAPLLSDHDARKGITFNSTLYDCSGTGDAITLTGTLSQTTVAHDIRIDIPVAGLPGTGKFRVSLNSGHDYVADGGSYDITIPVGLTYAIPGTAMTLNFANVSYNLNAIYYASVESWADQSGNGHTFTRQAANSGPLLQRMGRSNNGFSRKSKGVMGRWALVADALNVLENTGTWAADLAGGTNNTFHLFVVASSDNPAAGAQAFVAVGRSSNATPFLYLGEDGASDWAHTWRNDANATGSANSTGDVGNTRAHVFELEYDGTNSITRVDGVTVGSSAVARGAMTVDRGAFFALIRNTVGNRAKASIARVVAYTGNLSAPEAATARTQLAGIHDIVTPKNVRVSIDGDSFADAANGNSAFPNVMLFGNDNVTLVNAAVTGSTVAGMVSRAATVDANYSAGADRNILFIHCGTNDLGVNGTGDVTALQTAMQAYVAARKAVGYYVVINTIIARVDAGGVNEASAFATKRAIYNNWIRDGGSGADAVCDVDSGFPATQIVDPLWRPDGTHPGPAGASWISTNRAEPAYRAAVA